MAGLVLAIHVFDLNSDHVACVSEEKCREFRGEL
jgi:hypothetical protein